MDRQSFARVARGSRAAWKVLQREGPAGLAQRTARRAYALTGAAELDFPLADDDIADSFTLNLRPSSPGPPAGAPAVVGWVTAPPSPNSGGHTTMFRLLEAVEQAGHPCELYLYDRHGVDVARHEAVMRRTWPSIRARVLDVREGLEGVDALVATSWATAHVVARRGGGIPCLYLVQDYEPFFYPRGARYALAEDTYRFGFRCVTVGHMVSSLLRELHGVPSQVAEFGCDTEVYKLMPRSKRSGVVFYAKPSSDRRGFALARLALKQFHESHPGVEIHVFGEADVRLPFPATQHGRLRPAELAELYNQCTAGFALSFTNISLIAEEMLACGAVPVVNDSPYARADLQNRHVEWAPPTPSGLSRGLALAVARNASEQYRTTLADSVRSGWGPACRTFTSAILEEVSRSAEG